PPAHPRQQPRHQPAPPQPTTEHTPTTTQQPITEAAANRHRNAAERPRDGPEPSQTIARKQPTTQTSTQNKPAGQNRGNGGNNRVKNVKRRGLGWFNH